MKDHLCRCGWSREELEDCSEEELRMMCKDHEDSEEEYLGEGKGKKKKNWIKGAIKHPGSLKKSLDKEKISKSDIEYELDKLEAKDKDPKKPGVQGLSKKDLKKYRRLNLAKTLRKFNEHQETQNYMFFSNLQTIKRLVDEMLEMDESELDDMLSEHDWASDHISVATENIEHVFNFVASHEDPMSSEEDYEGENDSEIPGENDSEIPGGNWEESDMPGVVQMAHNELENEEELEAQKESSKVIKSFSDFNTVNEEAFDMFLGKIGKAEKKFKEDNKGLFEELVKAEKALDKKNEETQKHLVEIQKELYAKLRTFMKGGGELFQLLKIQKVDSDYTTVTTNLKDRIMKTPAYDDRSMWQKIVTVGSGAKA
jgi:hypothetical protein